MENLNPLTKKSEGLLRALTLAVPVPPVNPDSSQLANKPNSEKSDSGIWIGVVVVLIVVVVICFRPQKEASLPKNTDKDPQPTI